VGLSGSSASSNTNETENSKVSGSSRKDYMHFMVIITILTQYF